MDEVLTRAMTRKPEPIEWDETTTTAAAVPEEAPVEEEASTLTRIERSRYRCRGGCHFSKRHPLEVKPRPGGKPNSFLVDVKSVMRAVLFGACGKSRPAVRCGGSGRLQDAPVGDSRQYTSWRRYPAPVGDRVKAARQRGLPDART